MPKHLKKHTHTHTEIYYHISWETFYTKPCLGLSEVTRFWCGRKT